MELLSERLSSALLPAVTADFARVIDRDFLAAARARVARALEEGLIALEQAASTLHVPVQDVYRWAADSGLQIASRG